MDIDNTNNPHKSRRASDKGQLVLQTVAMPKDANAAGDIFGGWLVSQMDIGGAVLAQQCAKNRVATVAIDHMVFLKPVYVGDLVCCYATILKTGRSSIRLHIDVFAHRMRYGSCEQVSKAVFTFVALDDLGKPKAIDWKSVEPSPAKGESGT